MSTIFTVGIFISLFQCLLLFNKRSKTLPDRVLAIWMLIIGINLISYNLYPQGYWTMYPHLVGLTAPFPFFYGPLLYLYVSYSLRNEKHLDIKDYLHFLPVILSYLYLSRFYFFYSADEKRMIDAGEMDDFQWFSVVLLIGFVISGVTYTILSYQKLTRYSSLLQNNFSNMDRLNMNWLKGLIWGVGVLFLVVAVSVIIREVAGIQLGFNPDYVIYSIMISGILILGYFGIRHQNIFTDNEIVDVDAKGAYLKSGLKEIEAQEKHAELLRTMEKNKPYLQPKLSLSSLAEMLEISPNYLSQIINQYEEVNFNDFVNHYRVEEFIRLAAENPHHSFLAIALEAGFNSKSTFNKLFKKHKGMTPSQFLEATAV